MVLFWCKNETPGSFSPSGTILYWVENQNYVYPKGAASMPEWSLCLGVRCLVCRFHDRFCCTIVFFMSCECWRCYFLARMVFGFFVSNYYSLLFSLLNGKKRQRTTNALCQERKLASWTGTDFLFFRCCSLVSVCSLKSTETATALLRRVIFRGRCFV